MSGNSKRMKNAPNIYIGTLCTERSERCIHIPTYTYIPTHLHTYLVCAVLGLGGPPSGVFPPALSHRTSPPPASSPRSSSPPRSFPTRAITHPALPPPPRVHQIFLPGPFPPVKFPSGIHAQPKRQKEAKRRPRMSCFIEK